VRLEAFLARESPDVVCLQELKVTGDEFPYQLAERCGYHAAVHGQKTYHGVAILSRVPPARVTTGFGDGEREDEARLVSASVGGVRVASLYVPNGQTPGSEKWEYKLEWLARLRAWLEREHRPDAPLVLGGDFNVAPEDRDVARPEEWSGTVLCHEDGRRAFSGLAAWGLVDVVRARHPGPGPYTWWDYRQLAFVRGDGLRIDHILATRPLAERCRDARVDRDERKGKLPSDHAPVIAEFDNGENR
jgi:exodeoxyribonuclease-3